MANAHYEIVEFRGVIKPEWTELYVLCTRDSDGGVLVGGWYMTIVPPQTPALEALRDALAGQSFLTEWTRGCIPPL